MRKSGTPKLKIRKAAIVVALGAAGLVMWLSQAEPALGQTSLSSLEQSLAVSDDTELPRLEREATRAIQVAPESAYAHYLLSAILMRQFSANPTEGRFVRQASELAEQAVELDPLSDYGYLALSQALDTLGHTHEAWMLLDKAEEVGMQPSWRTWLMKARLVTDGSLSHRAEVSKLLEKAMSAFDCNRDVVAPYVVAFVQQTREGEDVIGELGHWSARYPHVVFDQGLAVAHAERGRYADAHRIYQVIRAKNAYSREAWVNDAIILYRELSRPKEAVAILNEVLRRDAGSLGKDAESLMRMHLASALLKLSDDKAATAEFIQALRVVPSKDLRESFQFVARTYEKQHKTRQLVAFIDQVSAEFPGQGIFHAIKGDTLSKDLNDQASALKAFDDAIVLEPGRADYHGGIGLVYYRMKHYEDAAKAFSAAMKLDPEDPTPRYNLACSLALMGRRDESLGVLSEALALDPRLQQTAMADKDFATFRGDLKFKELVDGTVGTASEAMPAH